MLIQFSFKIKNIINISQGAKIMKIQRTEWGYIEWRHIHDENDKKQLMDIRISVVLPGKSQPKHTHYSEEQMLYVISGEGVHVINGNKKHVKAGDFVYIDGGATHETHNIGEVPLRELLVSNPVIVNNYDYEGQKLDGLKSIIETIQTQFIEPLNIPITIYDSSWNLLLQTKCFNNYCIRTCGLLNGRFKYCECLTPKNNSEDEQYSFKCSHGLTIYHIPIIYEGNIIGYIRGGHILLASDGKKNDHKDIYDTPTGTAISIKRLLIQIAKSIVNYYGFANLRNEVQEKNMAIEKTSKLGEELKNNLIKEKEKVTNLKINHHFLFNTLNSMASMALENDCFDLYSAIIDLSKLFRYTMKVESEFTELEKEIDYVKKYLNLQKIRYSDELEVEYDLDETYNNISVPFNFLQPIVENAFVHGFKDSVDKKKLKISTGLYNDRVRIVVKNNGSYLSDHDVCVVIQKIHNNSGHGLSLIHNKLQFAFGNNFKMDVISNEKDQTNFILDIPIVNMMKNNNL